MVLPEIKVDHTEQLPVYYNINQMILDQRNAIIELQNRFNDMMAWVDELEKHSHSNEPRRGG